MKTLFISTTIIAFIYLLLLELNFLPNIAKQIPKTPIKIVKQKNHSTIKATTTISHSIKDKSSMQAKKHYYTKN